jgi:hypothetical protein
MVTHGAVEWTDTVDGQDKKQTNNKDLFLRLDEGANEMRLVTQPYQYLVHKYKKEGDPGFGQKIPCSAIHGSCPLCDLKTDKAKRRWLLGVISRKTGTYKVLDISWSVFSAIQKLAQSARWGNPQLYDISVVVDKNGGATGYYSVQPLPKEPLSAADQLIKDNVDLEDLKRRVSPPEPSYVQKRMDKIDGVGAATASAPVANASSRSTASVRSATPPVSLADDSDEDFPSYDAT